MQTQTTEKPTKDNMEALFFRAVYPGLVGLIDVFLLQREVRAEYDQNLRPMTISLGLIALVELGLTLHLNPFDGVKDNKW